MLIKPFTPIWNKYRPVILKMMIESSKEVQSYQLSQHEFKQLSPKQKNNFTFSLQVENGKVRNGLKDSELAQDLWEILQMSPKATELISTAHFSFTMNKNFVLQVEKMNNN